MWSCGGIGQGGGRGMGGGLGLGLSCGGMDGVGCSRGGVRVSMC